MTFLEWVNLMLGVIGFFCSLALTTYFLSYGYWLGKGRAINKARKESSKGK